MNRKRIAKGVGLVFLAFGCTDANDARNTDAACPVGELDTARASDGAVGLALRGGASCAVLGDGSVQCWGDSLGAVPTTEPGPRVLVGVSQALEIDSSSFELCALRSGGSVVCGSDDDSFEEVPGLCGATGLAMSEDSSIACSVVAGGTVRCWGSLQDAVFGENAGSRARSSPLEVPDTSDAIEVATGRSGYACALKTDGKVVCWGGGPRSGDRPGILPAEVPEVSEAVSLTSTGIGPEVCAVLSDGTALCWNHGTAPSPLADLTDAVSIDVTSSHGCAVTQTGSVRCWGQNTNGQLGDGTLEASETAVEVQDLEGVVEVHVASRDSYSGHSCALLGDGSVRCWGAGIDGQLGNGASEDSPVPVEVQLSAER